MGTQTKDDSILWEDSLKGNGKASVSSSIGTATAFIAMPPD